MKTNTSLLVVRARAREGLSLVEMLIAVGVGVLTIGVVVSLSMMSAWNFKAMNNYTEMDAQSRNALDSISREVRNATALVAFSTNNPQFLRLTNSIDSIGVTITCDTNAGTLTLDKTGQPTKTLLMGCDAFHFQLFNRYPIASNNTFSFYGSTNILTGAVDPLYCKVINMNWKCSRSILGSKLNTEIVQTAQVVLRNKVK